MYTTKSLKDDKIFNCAFEGSNLKITNNCLLHALDGYKVYQVALIESFGAS